MGSCARPYRVRSSLGSGGLPLSECALSNQSTHTTEYGSQYAAHQSHYCSASHRAIEQVCPHIRVPTVCKVGDLLGLLANDVKKYHINDDERQAKQHED